MNATEFQLSDVLQLEQQDLKAFHPGYRKMLAAWCDEQIGVLWKHRRAGNISTALRMRYMVWQAQLGRLISWCIEI